MLTSHRMPPPSQTIVFEETDMPHWTTLRRLALPARAPVGVAFGVLASLLRRELTRRQPDMAVPDGALG